jgi:UDP-N-acetylmuramate dehydrogenase
VEIKSRAVRTFSREECNYGYRESIFKNGLKGKYIITSVVFRLSKQPVFKLNYQHLEEDVMKNGTIDLKAIRKIVIALRQSKLPDPKEYGNAGSFFMNPIVSKPYFLDLQSKYPQIPHYYVSETEEKLPAGWLIDQCGWKGKQAEHAAVHDKQALVLINKGGASGAEIVHLAEQIQASVQDKFGIQLKPEVNYI